MSEYQNQRAFQKQTGVFLGHRKTVDKRGRKLRRVKEVGMGFKTPEVAKTGSYIDRQCPWTGNVSIRGRILRGIVKTAKNDRSIVVRRDYLHYIRKYNRYEKRHTNIPAHISPALKVKVGDVVTIGECRPLSKTIRFNVLKVEPQSESVGKQFRLF